MRFLVRDHFNMRADPELPVDEGMLRRVRCLHECCVDKLNCTSLDERYAIYILTQHVLRFAHISRADAHPALACAQGADRLHSELGGSSRQGRRKRVDTRD